MFLTASFSLLVAAAGWYYMFYSRAAERLSGLEEGPLNVRRQHLRQLNGLVMFLMAVGFFAGFHAVDPARQPRAFVLIWTIVFLLLMIIVLLALVDLRLTWRLRERRRIARHEGSGDDAGATGCAPQDDDDDDRGTMN